MSLQHSRTRQGLTRAGRVLVPAAIVSLLALLIGWPVWHELNRPDRNRAQTAVSHIRMLNPRFVGQDSAGKGFSLSATEAARDIRDNKVIYLTDPVVALKSDLPSPTRLKSDKGVYTMDRRLLRLTGTVRIDDGSGYRFSSEEALVDLKRGELVGRERMLADGPMGEIEAQAYGVYDNGDRAVFTGGVRAKLD